MRGLVFAVTVRRGRRSGIINCANSEKRPRKRTWTQLLSRTNCHTVYQERGYEHVREDYTPERRSHKARTDRAGSPQRGRNAQQPVEQEAAELTNTGRYERTENRKVYRLENCERAPTTTSGDVKLKMPKLKGVAFEKPRSLNDTVSGERGGRSPLYVCASSKTMNGHTFADGPSKSPVSSGLISRYSSIA